MATFNEKRTCSERMQNFGRFVWNPDTGELMGRTLVKWVYISLYYVAFYIVMIGLFALSIYSLMQTLSMYHPDYQDMIQSPGVTVRPDVYVDDKIVLIYNKSDKSTYTKTVEKLCKFLAPYNQTVQNEMKNKVCSNASKVDEHFLSCSGRCMRACQFTTDMLGDCSHDKDPTFGFASGKPCFFFKINRIIHFTPGNKSAPYLQCTSKDENLGDVEYFPHNGTFGLQYFPYYGKKAQPNYTNPLVAVKFNNVTPNKEIEIVCKVIGQKIVTDNPHDPYEGKVTFKLKIMA